MRPERMRLGIINIMPVAESYEPYLLRPLQGAQGPIEPVWLRLESHQYTSSDPERIRARYQTYEEAMADSSLDALILTGAPVEELEFEAITYWAELQAILLDARERIPSTLGICWGGMALAHLIGLEKQGFPQKLFGVFENRVLAPEHALLRGSGASFQCAQSRHSGFRDADLEWAQKAGTVELLSHGEQTGYTVFASADQRYVMHLGHPEYEAERLVQEWQRDVSLGRADVARPQNFDPERPLNTWREHCTGFFSRWLSQNFSQARASSTLMR